jgi:leucyl-tRNA synthetase
MTRIEPVSTGSTCDFSRIEAKWQKRWADEASFRAAPDPAKPKLYILDMFPYPSGAGLHVGHPEGYTATDIIARMKRLQGYNVLHPMGWDAFGLPAENHAIATGQHPRETTARNVATFRRQIKSLGFSYDWSREVDTTDPGYYKWTQWIFLQLYKKGLAYEGTAPINFCPRCKTGLANEEVHQGACERCGAPVERRDLRQWLLRITAYADRLLADLEGLDWPESTLAMQRHWIGRSEGAEVVFAGPQGATIPVFTTRPDTLFGATYMVLAPEHPLVEAVTTPNRRAAVKEYVDRARAKSDVERTDLAKEKTGVFTGGHAVNPVNREEIPIWVADYVLSGYGAGAIMAVPAHDQRDYDFAAKFGLPVRPVVVPPAGTPPAGAAYEDEGISTASGVFSDLPTPEAKRLITRWLEEKRLGKAAVTYRLRDWVFSRQRYWGEPIPIVHCAGQCAGPVPVPEDQLPVLLPEVAKYEPTGAGDSPLAAVENWIKTRCPVCGGSARRETNTMPQWAGSCWYYLRYMDPGNAARAWDPPAEKYWMGAAGVDLYVGGAEHAVLHLLYSRFWHKVLFDLGLVSTKEPFHKLRHQGMVLSYSYRDSLGAYHPYEDIDFSQSPPRLKAGGGPLKEQVEKMSKSKKNVVSPDDVIREHGADVMRLYEMFMGDFDKEKPWDPRTIEGVARFLKRLWRLADKVADVPAPEPLVTALHRTVDAVTKRVDGFKFNTAIAALMEWANLLGGDAVPRSAWETYVTLLSPFAPHLAEELWERMGHGESITRAPWPTADPARLADREVEIPVQINGKVKDRLTAPVEAGVDALRALALARPRVTEALQGRELVKCIVIPGKMVSLVVKGGTP